LTDEDKESALNDVVEFRQVGSKHYKVEKERLHILFAMHLPLLVYS